MPLLSADGLFIGPILVSTLNVHSLEVGITDGLVNVIHCRILRSSARPDAMSCLPSSLLWFEQTIALT